MVDFHDSAARLAAAAAGIEFQAARELLTRPPKPELGDISFPCFTLAKQRRANPAQIAAELAAKIAGGGEFSRVTAAGPYVNFTISRASLAQATVAAALAAPERWGCGDGGRGKTAVLDFSSPNIAKPLGVHHIRSTMIGAALCRIYRACGWRVVSVNHLGDWGTSFGQLMVGYKKAEAENPSQPVDVDSLLKLYIRYHAEAENDESLADEARAWFRKLEAGDAEATRLWRIFVEESLKPLRQLYARLGVRFDHYTGESFFNDKMEATAARIRERGLLAESDGALVVELENYGMPPCLIRKRDGATTYATRDLAAAEYRHAEYDFDKCLYVVANQQELHFRQIFKTLELLGYAWASGCEHVKFGMLSFGKGVFAGDATTASTRKGNVIFLEDVLAKAVAAAREIILENAREEEVKRDADALAETVGVGAVVFNEFLQRRVKDVVFTWEKALNLQGDSGPYLQYTHARLSSVLRKYGRSLPERIAWERLETECEREVIAKVGEYPAAVEAALRENEPSLVATYLLDLAAVFNRMFTDKERHRIIGDDAELTGARVGLVEAVRVTLRNGLALLGLGAPERM